MRPVWHDARHDAHIVETALDAAAALIADDPDAAALQLDGVLRRMIQLWYARRGLRAPADGRVLADIERRAPPLAWRLRLALRAPDARARLAHLRGLLAALHAHDTSRHPGTMAAARVDDGAPASRKLRAPLVAAPRSLGKGT